MPHKSSVLLVPDGAMNADDIFGIAVYYADSAIVIQDQSEHSGDPRYLFPAITCAVFALELFAKFFYFIQLRKYK